MSVSIFFVAVSVFGLVMTHQSKQDANQLEAAVHLMSGLQDVQYLASQEHGDLADYLSGRASSTAAVQTRAMATTNRAIRSIDQGLPGWRPLVTRIQSAQATYEGIARKEIMLIESGDLTRATEIDDEQLDPAAATLVSRVGALERAASDHGNALTASVNADTSLREDATPMVLGISWLLAMAYLLLLRRYQRRLSHAARTDHLTNLANRGQLHEISDRAVARAEASGPRPAILLLDLDHFKEVNDTLGHHVGDDLLVQTATRLTQSLPVGAVACRLGGDEFAVILPDTDRAGAQHTAEAIRQAIQHPYTLEGVVVDMDVSIGIATYEEGASTASLLRQADVAMYVAKESGSVTSVYTPDQDDHTTQRLTLMGEMRHALDNDELIVYYQPKTSVADNSVVGAEALVRWQHPTRGLLPPSEFVPHVEKTHLIYRLTLHVLKLALSQCREWLEQGRLIPVAVNVAARCLLDPEFPDTVRENLRRFGIEPNLLTLEVTETTVIGDLPRAKRAMEQLNRIGVVFALDDYGTGYSALSYVRDLPFTELKVDRYFVRHLATTDADAVLVGSTIQLAHSLGLKVVAEGVEDEAAHTRLQLLDCDIAQGYCIAKPMPATEFLDWLKSTGLSSAAASGSGSADLGPFA